MRRPPDLSALAVRLHNLGVDIRAERIGDDALAGQLQAIAQDLHIHAAERARPPVGTAAPPPRRPTVAALETLDELDRRLETVTAAHPIGGETVKAGDVLRYHSDTLRRVLWLFATIEERDDDRGSGNADGEGS